MAFPRSKLSDHAVDRIAERICETPSGLLEILNAGFGKRIGSTDYTKRIHRLVWSPKDDSLLVVIQDITDGTVLTVLTLDMYRNVHKEKLTDRRIRTVINQMVHAGLAPGKLWEPGAVKEHVTIYAYIRSRPSPVGLGRWKGKVTSLDLSKLGEKTEFWQWCVSRLQGKGFPIESLEQVTAKFAGGDQQAIPYRCERNR